MNIIKKLLEKRKEFGVCVMQQKDWKKWELQKELKLEKVRNYRRKNAGV